MKYQEVITWSTDVDKYDERNWGGNACEYALMLCLNAVLKL